MKTLPEQLHQLAPLAAQATAGPWEVIPNSEHTDSVYSSEVNHIENFGLGDFRSSDLCMNSGGFAHDADAAFIAAARNLLTPQNLTMIIGLLGNMESSFETNRVLVKRLVEIQGILENDLLDDTKLYLISEAINPSKIAKR